MKSFANIRKLRLESLEERTLLAVFAGGIETGAEIIAPTEATTWIVNTLEDPMDAVDNVVSLRDAIYRAQTGDTITFDDCLAGGTITLCGTELRIVRGITIDASSVGGITIDAGGKSEVLWTQTRTGDETNLVQLVGLTITGGVNPSGGGIINQECTLILTDCVVSGNTTNAVSSSAGGGIANYNGTLTLTNCTVSGNTAEYGGGIYNCGGKLTMTNCTILGNTASSSGGGIYNNNRGTLTLTNCAVSGNAYVYTGGGICNDNGTLTLTNCAIFVNTQTYYCQFDIISNSTGGGISNRGGTLTLTNCTVAGNSAGYAGGIYSYDTVNLYNTIVAQNTASSSVNDVGGNHGSFYAYNTLSSFVDWTESEDCLVYNESEPLFFYGCYVLAPNSQAINKGNNSYISDYETDISGTPRIIGGTVDIGAYEYQEGVDYETPSTIVTTDLDIADPYDNVISLREAISYATIDDTITFDSSLANRTIVLSGMELVIDKGITIDAGVIGGLTIDANSKSRVFNISGGTEEVSAELIDLIITGGCAGSGGGIRNTGSLTMTNCIILYNTCKFLGPHSYGGGIYNEGNLTLTNCTISGNSSHPFAGGFYSLEGALTMMGCTVSGNISTHGGGGMAEDGTTTMTNCTVSGNTARNGGGILNCAMLTLTNCIVSGNTASSSGGGIYNESATLTMMNCTVTRNSAYEGGGLHNADYSSSTSNIYNSIIVQNTDVSLRNDICKSSNSPINAYNTLSSFTDWTESENCIVYDPTIPLFTDALHGDFTPAENSQAVNNGNNDYVTTNTDLAGNPRIYGGIVDIGAYEYKGVPAPAPTEQLEVPTITTGNKGVYVSYGANRHRITWTAVENASGYELAYTTDGVNWSSGWVGGTNGAVGNLTYGSYVTYRVRALGEGPYVYSDWSETKTFLVCPMDINGDGDISGTDRTILSSAWLTSIYDEGAQSQFYADIDGNGDVSNSDRTYLANNWLHEVDDDDLSYPKPVAAADVVFSEFESGDLGVDLDTF